jgi:hypothetical protein
MTPGLRNRWWKKTRIVTIWARINKTRGQRKDFFDRKGEKPIR